MKKIVIASNNAGKLREIADMSAVTGQGTVTVPVTVTISGFNVVTMVLLSIFTDSRIFRYLSPVLSTLNNVQILR